MKFVFWQNILSLHQNSFLEYLSHTHSVILVVEEEMSEDKLKSGWNIPEYKNVTVVVTPSLLTIYHIVMENKDSIHVLAGIHAFPLIRKAFFFIRFFKVKTMVYSEPYNFLGWKGYVRHVVTMLEAFLFSRHIDGLLLTGELGCGSFQKAKFPKEKIYQWGYFVEPALVVPALEPPQKKPSLLFVGSIDKRKNILPLTKVVKDLLSCIERFTIIGVGPLSCKLERIIEDTDQIKYLGSLPNKKVNEQMQQHDILILPSLFDGWGAVINEALQNGMRVICSANCGAASLLKEEYRGEIFSFDYENDLKTVLKRNVMKGGQTIEQRERIIEWSKKHISGEVAASYFIDICQHIYYKKEKPHAPWM